MAKNMTNNGVRLFEEYDKSSAIAEFKDMER